MGAASLAAPAVLAGWAVPAWLKRLIGIAAFVARLVFPRQCGMPDCGLGTICARTISCASGPHAAASGVEPEFTPQNCDEGTELVAVFGPHREHPPQVRPPQR